MSVAPLREINVSVFDRRDGDRFTRAEEQLAEADTVIELRCAKPRCGALIGRFARHGASWKYFSHHRRGRLGGGHEVYDRATSTDPGKTWKLGCRNGHRRANVTIEGLLRQVGESDKRHHIVVI